MIPFVLSFEDFVEGVDGVMDQYTYRLQYMDKMYYINMSLPIEELSVVERQNAVLNCFGEAFLKEQEDKLGERPQDVRDMIDDILDEVVGDEDSDSDDEEDTDL